jgi:acyl-coenzyme A thioesterase PaaI-like protein
MATRSRNDVDSDYALGMLGYVREDLADGWTWRNVGKFDRFDDQFNGLTIRCEDSGQVRIRCIPGTDKLNLNEVIHGAYLLALADHALFITPMALGRTGVLGGSTIEVSAHYYAPASVEFPVDIVAEVMRETGRMVFVRGTLEQDGTAVAGFSGTIQKFRSCWSNCNIRGGNMPLCARSCGPDRMTPVPYRHR